MSVGRRLAHPCAMFARVGLLIVLGVARDVPVDGRVHKVYLYALPILIVGQSLAVYIWRSDSSGWHGIAHAILG